MKRLVLNEQAMQYTATRNRYGDVILTKTGYIKCLFRNISMLNHIQNSEEELIVGQFWFDPTATVKMGDVIGIYNELYRVKEVTIARDRLKSNTVQFIKANVNLYRAIS